MTRKPFTGPDREHFIDPHRRPLIDPEIGFARAMRSLQDDNRHLDEISAQFKVKFSSLPSFDQIFMGAGHDSRDVLRIGAAIFFIKDSDVTAAQVNGTTQTMRDFICEKLEEYGRGKRDELNVEFEFDSFENVQKNYEGSYFLRMR